MERRISILDARISPRLTAALFAIWGVVSLGWLFTGFKGLVVKAEAADFFGEDNVPLEAITMGIATIAERV